MTSFPPADQGNVADAMVAPLRIEEAALNALQTQRQLFLDGWLVRLSPGAAKRARSVNPHFGSSMPIDAKVDRCEAIYAAHRLPVLFRITPFCKPPELDEVLARRGYVAFDATLVQVARLAPGTAEPRDRRRGALPAPVAEFVEAVGELRGSTPVQRAAHFERLSNTPLTCTPLSRGARADRRLWPRRTRRRARGDLRHGDRRGLSRPRPRDMDRCGASNRAGQAGARARIPASQRGQCARAGCVWEVRLRDGLRVPLSRAPLRMLRDDNHVVLAAELGRALVARGWRVATAESCTGGLVAGAITAIAGSSAWFDRGFVTYSNEAKHELLGVATERSIDMAPCPSRSQPQWLRARGAQPCAMRAGGDRLAGPGGGTARSRSAWCVSAGPWKGWSSRWRPSTSTAIARWSGPDRSRLRCADCST